MIDWAMHAKRSGRGDPLAFRERFIAAENASTAGIIDGYQPEVKDVALKDVAPKVAITSSKVPSE